MPLLSRPARSRSGRTRRAGSDPVPARLSDATLPSLDQTIPPWPGRTVPVAGVDLFIRTIPSPNSAAEPALYVHGLGGSGTNWTDLAAQLAPTLSGESIDLPGFGNSGPALDHDYSLRSQAGIVAAYLERSGRGPVHLFGNSMGGAISIMVAARRPDLIRTLTLISPAVSDRRPVRMDDPRVMVLLMPGIGIPAMRRVEQVPIEKRVRQVIQLCFADPTRQPAHRMDEALAEAQLRPGMSWSTEAFVRATRGLAATYASGRMWPLMASITAPTLVIWGDQDRLVHVRHAPLVASAIPGARLQVQSGVGHVAMMEDPTTTARAVLGLLEDARSRTT